MASRADDPPDPPPDQVITLAGDHALSIRRRGGDDEIAIVGPTGAGVTVSVTREGITVTFGGADVRLRTPGALAIHAGEIALHGARGVAITSGGAAEIRAAGDLVTSASAQRIEARDRDVVVEANDDVRLDGERVRLNSPDAAPAIVPRGAGRGRS